MMPALREIFAEYGVVFDRQRNLQRGNRMVSRMGSALRRMRGPVVAATQALGAMAVAAGAGAAAGLQQIVSSTIESTREIDRWAGRLSTSSDALRSWIALGSEYGASIDDVTDALKELQLKGQDALTGGTAQAEMFERIGISLDDLRPIINDTDALMALFTTRLNAVNDVALRNFTVDELMSDAGTRMNEVFALGTREIASRRSALTRSIGPTEDLSRTIADHVLIVRGATRRWERLKREITTYVLPLFGQLVRRVAAFEEPARRMIRALTRIITETNILKGVLIGVAAAAIVTAALTIGAWGPVVLAFIGVTVAVAAVAGAYDQVTRSLEGSDTALKTFLKDHLGISNDEIQGSVLLLGDAWERLTGRIAGAGEALRSFVAEIQPLITAIQYVWRFISFASGGGIVDLFGGSLLDRSATSLREATQARTAEEEERTAPGEARATRNAQAAKGETTDTWTGQRLDESGFPVSAPAFARTREIPTIPRSATISETRIPRPESSAQQTVAVDAPMTLNFDIAEATDAQEITRLVTRGVTEAQSRWTSELESLISDQTEVGS